MAKIGFKKLSKQELQRLRGGKGSACCTVSTANSSCTTSALTCTSNGAAKQIINGKMVDANGKEVVGPKKVLRARPRF